MNIFTEHILQCNQSEPLADASGRIVDLMNENRVPNEEKKSFNFFNFDIAWSQKLRSFYGTRIRNS